MELQEVGGVPQTRSPSSLEVETFKVILSYVTSLKPAWGA